MPLIEASTYEPPGFLAGAHAQTVFPTVARCVRGVAYRRERLELADGDFVDIDWSTAAARRAVVISHGLEGDSSRVYVLGMARALNRRGWDVAAWNFRGCSGEPNRHLRLYHSGATEDLDQVVAHLSSRYETVALVGFSLGGNLTLKYLGELGADASRRRVRAGAVFSVPCDLAASSTRMSGPENRFYLKRFLRDLRGKVRMKAGQFPERVTEDGYDAIRSFWEFDDRYTAPMHGFADAADYYGRCSARHFVEAIRVPTLLVNALDDPFLTPECAPVETARSNPDFFLERPAHGGHVGFVRFNKVGEYWSEERAGQFLGQVS